MFDQPRQWTAFVLLLLAATVASSESVCDPDGVQDSGSIYRICMPPPGEYNGDLMIWAHGFQDAGTPVEIPEDQLCLDDFCIPDLVNGLGFGFATNSYSKTGLAVRQGMADIIDLVDIYAAEKGQPTNVYLVGASEGGVITALLVEGRPDLFDAGIAACGPVGDFPYQINYFGDARVVFDYFFPGLIPGDPFDPPQDLVEGWKLYYELVVKPVVFQPANLDRLNQLVAVARLPFDSSRYLETVEESLADVLRYSVVNFHDATQTLGGFPYDNQFRWYSGSNNDLVLNLAIPRVAADPAAVIEMETFYDTSGDLEAPLITLHTTRDQQVPFFHELLYLGKTIESGAFLTRHVNLTADRYGHCEFTTAEVLLAVTLMLAYDANPVEPSRVDSLLAGHELERSHERSGVFAMLRRRTGLTLGFAVNW